LIPGQTSSDHSLIKLATRRLSPRTSLAFCQLYLLVHRALLNGVRGRVWGRRTSRISSCTSFILTPRQDVKVPVRSDRRNCTEEGRSWLAGHRWGTGWRKGIRWPYLDVPIEHTGLCLPMDAVCNSVQMTSPAAKKTAYITVSRMYVGDCRKVLW